jgi:hypothetical protein
MLGYASSSTKWRRITLGASIISSSSNQRRLSPSLAILRVSRWGIDAIAERGGCIAPSTSSFAHFEDNFTHGYSLGGWFGVASRPKLRPGGEKVEVDLLIDNEITFEPGVTYSLKEHGSRGIAPSRQRDPHADHIRSCTPWRV